MRWKFTLSNSCYTKKRKECRIKGVAIILIVSFSTIKISELFSNFNLIYFSFFSPTTEALRFESSNFPFFLIILPYMKISLFVFFFFFQVMILTAMIKLPQLPHHHRSYKWALGSRGGPKPTWIFWPFASFSPSVGPLSLRLFALLGHTG